MPVPFFQNDEAYRQWLAANPSGFVGNVYPRDVALHRAGCPHIAGSLPNGRSPTGSYEKRCHRDLQRLVAWATEQGKPITERCSCRP